MTFWGIMKRSAAILNEACLAGWAVFVGSERGLAGESGVASRPAGSATAVQNTLVAGGVALGRRHDVSGAGSGKLHGFDGLRRFPVSSNQFQTNPITF